LIAPIEPRDPEIHDLIDPLSVIINCRFEIAVHHPAA
jgi:hypothetical protein